MKKINKEKVIFFLILLLSIIIRILKWSNLFETMHVDESMTAINANTIAKYGTDMYGTSFPVFFETWKWGGQTAVLTYLMAVCIKVLGFNIFAIRLPMLVISIISIVVMYLFVQQLTKNKKIALIAMFFTAISPWHILQSQFSLDCNMFPHVVLIATYILYNGIQKNKKIYIYLSMFFYGISMYTYGLATYFVPILLLILAIYFFVKKNITLADILICVGVYLIISLPLLIMYIINFFKLGNSIEIGCITIPFLPDFERVSDILFYADNIFLQLIKNVWNLIKILTLQSDYQYWNSIPFFGTTYILSAVFLIYAIYATVKNRVKDNLEKVNLNIIFIWFMVALGIGILVKDLTVYKINIIWYPLIIIISYGIYVFCELYKNKFRYVYKFIITLYLILLILFFVIYNSGYITNENDIYFWDSGLVQAVEYIENRNYEKVLIVDYNTYRFFERTKSYVRVATNYNIDKYNNEKPYKLDIQYTDKYRITATYFIKESEFKDYSAVIVPIHEEIKTFLLKEGYTAKYFSKYYVVYEK